MLGMTSSSATDEVLSAASLMQKGSRLAPIVKQSKEDLYFDDSSSSLSVAQRASSQIGGKKSLMSQGSFGKKSDSKPSLRTQSVTKHKTDKQLRSTLHSQQEAGKRKTVESDSDLELFDDMIEKEMLDQALEEQAKKEKRAEQSWKHNFLYRFMEYNEEVIKKMEYDDFYLKKPKNLRTREQPKDT